jgi:thiol-disulfide isomerase/thioredoxin
VRTDHNVARLSFRHSDQWRTDPFANARVPEIDRRLEGAEIVNGRLVVHSLSGHERNHLFLNRNGQTFEDISLISGLDSPADGRCFVTFDYDHDGQLDIALVNANKPLLNLYQNQIKSSSSSPAGENQFMAIRFVGANHRAEASRFSSRDGYGAMVEVTMDGAKLKREHRCGEGYGSQNSATMIVGLGAARTVDRIQVRWPSGKQTHLEQVPAGSLVTTFEDARHSGHDAHFNVQPYVQQSESIAKSRDELPSALPKLPPLEIAPGPSQPDGTDSPSTLKVYLTMATWCTACLEHLPHWRRVASTFSNNEIELVGLPVDPEDNREQLVEYYGEVNPPYRLRIELTPPERAAIQRVMDSVIPADAIPATIVTDASGNVRHAAAGAPTISQLRKLLTESAAVSVR